VKALARGDHEIRPGAPRPVAHDLNSLYVGEAVVYERRHHHTR